MNLRLSEPCEHGRHHLCDGALVIIGNAFTGEFGSWQCHCLCHHAQVSAAERALTDLVYTDPLWQRYMDGDR